MDLQPRSLAEPPEVDRWWRWSERLPPGIRRLFRSRFVRFLIVGGLNTLFGYLVFAALIFARVPYPAAAFLSTVAGLLFNFKSYGTLVFGSGDNARIVRFLAVYGVCYLLGLALLALGEAHGVSVLAVAAVAAIPLAGISFLLCRRFVFRGAEATIRGS
jgi:putative flippase GtrA